MIALMQLMPHMSPLHFTGFCFDSQLQTFVINTAVRTVPRVSMALSTTPVCAEDYGQVSTVIQLCQVQCV